MATDKKHKIPNAPNLRFPEFEREWKNYKVSELLNFFPTNSLSWEQLEYDIDSIQNLHYGLIHVGLPTSVNLKYVKLPCIKNEFIPRNYELCKNGDVAFADASEDTNDVAKAIEFTDLDNKMVVCGLHTIHGRDKGNLTISGFKGSAFSSPAFHNQIRRIAQGTKVFSISNKNFDECVIGIPLKEEQRKIADLFTLIDDRIQTQIGAIEKIESLISCLYDKLFQTETGETKPLKEICQIRKGEQVNSDQLSEKGEYYVMNGGITPSGYWNKFNTESRTISISEGGNSCGYVQYNKHRFWSGGHCYTLHPDNERVLTKYLFHYLKYRQQDIMALRIGSGLPNIQKKDLENYRILITPFTKQMHIVEILDGFYCKLNIEEQLLEQYKLQKQYLLSQMFV